MEERANLTSRAEVGNHGPFMICGLKDIFPLPMPHSAEHLIPKAMSHFSSFLISSYLLSSPISFLTNCLSLIDDCNYDYDLSAITCCL